MPLVIALLCSSVVLHILGVQIAFWDWDGSSDLVASAALEGFTVISVGTLVFAFASYTIFSERCDPAHRLLPPHLLFRPPLG
jgi:hypothetical protein